jgi:FkbM family methyltransferase
MAEELNSQHAFNQLVQTRHGPMLYNRHDRYVGGSLAAYGEFSEGEAAMFRQLVGPGNYVIEAGANIGAHTVQLSRLVGDAGRVIAFEPQRLVFQALCANLALNQCVNVEAWQQGLGESAGQMLAPAVDPRLDNNFGGLSLQAYGTGEPVQVTTIDELELPRCDFIKADVEGMEQAVVEGARKTIASFRPLLYLENDREDKSPDLIRLLQSLDYRLWWHTPPLFNPHNFANNAENHFGGILSINILCQPVERAKPVSGMREITGPGDSWRT